MAELLSYIERLFKHLQQFTTFDLQFSQFLCVSEFTLLFSDITKFRQLRNVSSTNRLLPRNLNQKDTRRKVDVTSTDKSSNDPSRVWALVLLKNVMERNITTLTGLSNLITARNKLLGFL